MDGLSVNDELETMWKEAADVAYFKSLFRHWHGSYLKIMKTCQVSQPPASVTKLVTS